MSRQRELLLSAIDAFLYQMSLEELRIILKEAQKTIQESNQQMGIKPRKHSYKSKGLR